MYINSPGGRLDTTISILQAMHESEAKIITVADGKVASAVTFIFLSGDEKVYGEDSYFMFHQYMTDPMKSLLVIFVHSLTFPQLNTLA